MAVWGLASGFSAVTEVTLPFSSSIGGLNCPGGALAPGQPFAVAGSGVAAYTSVLGIAAFPTRQTALTAADSMGAFHLAFTAPAGGAAAHPYTVLAAGILPPSAPGGLNQQQLRQCTVTVAMQATPSPSGTPTATATVPGFTYHLPAGWSMIALPGAPTSPVYASGLLIGLLLQSQGSLAALYGLTNNRWSPYLIDDHQPGTGLLGEDFVLQQGVGYLLYSDRRVDFTLRPAAGSGPVAVPKGERRPARIPLPPLPPTS
jgi:hypothetical protein